jgi:acetyl-CoA carboxylase biotin carboxylase subunit
MFRRILVANRGEIAVRVMRTCREMGIPTVAVYSEPDRSALHTIYATEAYAIGPAPSRESYLNIARIIEVAKRAKADAIHPGYGFLSERPAFAKACRDAGITFIGPSAEAITTMGDKTVARRAMIAASVPVVPGTEEPITGGAEAAISAARSIGYPVMVKAAAGGGGKGMRLVHDEAQLGRAFEAAGREALSAFGDGSVYLERFIQNPRHIEIQVFGDTHGNTIHLNERECSIQRRNQKVIEESPSPFVDAELRARMGEVAVRAARAVGYVGAGTIEFLVDESRRFYFLEMNTRLQVEHPVTELTTGYDLVREQIMVASGAKLSLTEKPPYGHAIEARMYAENPSKNFAPSPGRISYLRTPGGPGVRVDSGVYTGYEVTPYYDPMIAKLAVWSIDRASAIRRLDRALSETVVNGIDTNITFLRRVVQHRAFAEGRTDTGFIDRHVAAKAVPEEQFVQVAMITAAIRQYEYTRELADKIVKGKEGPSVSSRWRELGRRDAFLSRSGSS